MGCDTCWFGNNACAAAAHRHAGVRVVPNSAPDGCYDSQLKCSLQPEA
jgi:hypothetical protein